MTWAICKFNYYNKFTELTAGSVSLLESPEWTRHGEPSNYENYAGE